MLTTAIVYLYHSDPCNFPMLVLNYPSAALHIRNIIIAIIQTGQAPILTHDPMIPLTPLTPVQTSRTPCCSSAPADNRTTPAQETHRNTISNINPAITHARQTPYGGISPHHTAVATNQQLHDISLIKITTWKLNRQSTYDGPISVCLQGNIDLLYCTETAAYISIPSSPASFSLTRTADKAGYAVYITPHNHIYIGQNTLLTRLITQQSSHAGRLHVFIFKGNNYDHTAVIGLYAFQREHKTHITSTHTPPDKPTQYHQHNNPKELKQDLLTLINNLKTAYQQLNLLIIGDFQHTVHNNTPHRMGRPQPPPPANILTPCLMSPMHLVSVIPTQHPNEPYHIWCSHSGRGHAGLDHILDAPEHIHPECSCGIDRELSRKYLKSDRYVIYTTFTL